ncbi:ABC transporter ATP-binding protein [Nguyenibacter sp. L1]|nr:ABC transporter ATP-binding protein [Nguyenibacter sp. L1]WRH87239.1 ABC transporter ATP-binding protein [Nguyenibacter sp. L1]
MNAETQGAAQPAAAAVVDVRDLVKAFGTCRALDGLSFAIAPGEIVALLGPNGAGKSTLIGCLLGFLLPGSGTVSIWGQEAGALDALRRARMGYVPQAMNAFGSFRVGQLIAYLGGFYASVPQAPDPALLAWADLDPAARVGRLSGGQKQRLAIVLALRHRPDFLILDEPVASLDPQARRDFMALLDEYCARTGACVLMSSHILSDLEKVATRALFMARGRIVHDTPMERFRRATRWIVPAGDGGAAPPTGPAGPIADRLPAPLTCLGRDAATGALLVDGWDDRLADALQAAFAHPVSVRHPDLEAAFLEITR